MGVIQLRPAKKRKLKRRSLTIGAAAAAILTTLVLCSSASAITFGIDWSSYGDAENAEVWEVLQHSGATEYRMAMGPSPAGGTQNWVSYYDKVVRLAAEHGITILPALGDQTVYPTGSEIPAWDVWVEEAVARYGYNGAFWQANPTLTPHPIEAWEVTNEPNLIERNPPIIPGGSEEAVRAACRAIGETYYEEHNNCVQPERYGELLVSTSAAIQEASRRQSGGETQVLFGGLGIPYGDSYEDFLTKAYNVQGVFDAFTGLSIHPYGFDPTHTAGDKSINEVTSEITGVRNFLAGLPWGPTRTLWITELGWPLNSFGNPHFPAVQGPEEQARLLSQSFLWIKFHASELGIRSLYWYNDQDNGVSSWDYTCGLREQNGYFRPAWASYQEATGAPAWPPPGAETGPAVGIKETQATFTGTVTPKGRTTIYRFEYGKTTKYGFAVPIPEGNAGFGGGPQAVSAVATGLAPNTHYHYRIVAHNGAGVVLGADQTFSTGVKWVVKNGNSAGEGDKTFWFGLPGEIRVSGDWNGDGIATPGVYNPETGVWKLRNSNSTGPADITFQFGGSNFTPVTGDWDGNGTTTVGLYEPSGGNWVLRNVNSGTGTNISFQFGGSSFTPVTGDWDGNGTTTVGLYEPNAGEWVERNVNSATGTNNSFQFGGSAFKPVTGDWDGNGTTTVGLYEPNAGEWVERNVNSGSGTNNSFRFGGSNFTPITGDWDGDGASSVGLTDPNAQGDLSWVLHNANAPEEPKVPNISFGYGSKGEIAVSGDWDGNGTTTSGTYNPATGVWKLRNGPGEGPADITFQFGGSNFTPVTGDWDGNGTTTVGLYEPSGGNWVLRNVNSGTGTNISFQFGGSSFTPVTGDWDGNGTTTVGLYEPSGGNWVLRNVNSGTGTNISFQFGGSSFTPVTGDWDGNGTTTVGLYEPNAGQWVERNVNSGTGTNNSFQFGGSTFTPITGDWDGDGTTTVGLTGPTAQGGLNWVLRNVNAPEEPKFPNISFNFGSYEEIAVSGDWDGNGTTTSGTYNPATGVWKLRNGPGEGPAQLTFQFGGSNFVPVTGDWDGNGTTTVGLYEPSGGNWVLRNVNSGTGTNISFQFGGSSFTPVTGDWDGNGTTTVGLYEPNAGEWVERNVNSATGTNNSFQFGGSAFKPVTGDWDGNGTITVGLYEQSHGKWVLRNVNSGTGTNISFQFGGSTFTPITGDWDGDGTTTVGLITPP